MKVYRISFPPATLGDDAHRDGYLETATLIRTDIAEGASAPTDLVRESDGRVARCTIGMWLKSPEEAWRRHAESLSAAIDNTLYGISESMLRVRRMQQELEKIRGCWTPWPVDKSKPNG